jgi:hypothetical protein
LKKSKEKVFKNICEKGKNITISVCNFLCNSKLKQNDIELKKMGILKLKYYDIIEKVKGE